MTYKAVFFDLDGTLVDTLEDLTDAMSYALNQLGLPSITCDACREMVGNGVGAFADKALPDNAKHLKQKLVELMKTRYALTYLDKTRIYDGMADVVAKCSRKGLVLGVVSNKPHPMTVKITEHYFGTDVFGVILGQKEEIKIKPDPEPIYLAMKTAGIRSPQDVLYIGDSDVDVETARNAGIDFVAVGWGFRSELQLRQAGAEKIIYDARELLGIILG